MRNGYFLLVLVALLLAPVLDRPAPTGSLTVKLPSLKTVLAYIHLRC